MYWAQMLGAQRRWREWDGEMKHQAKKLFSTIGFARRFAKAKAGVTAIEFALLALPFFAMMSMIIETSVIFVSTSSLDSAVGQTARIIRTGQLQSSNMTQAAFTDLICANLMLVSNCSSTLKVDVRKFSTFGGATFPALIDSNGNPITTTAYQPGTAGDIVIVRAFYPWKMMSPISLGFNNLSGNQHLISASVAFRNEPFTN